MASLAPMITVTNNASYQTELNTIEQKQKEEEKEISPPIYLDDSPNYDFKDMTPADRKEFLKDSESIFSSSTLTPSATFIPTKKLLINARGIGVLRLPVPPSEMQISITTPSEELVYVSTRSKRSSGNAVLSSVGGKQLVKSEYLWGPGRDPKLRVLLGDGIEGEEISVKSKWTSRRQEFKNASGEGFVWRYVREVDAASGKKRTFLIMEVDASSSTELATQVIGKAKDGYHGGTRRVAQLIRNEEARTPGTKSCCAGNGGELVIDELALGGTGFGDEVVVASCLMMLKKEIDRRRMVQMIMISGAASGGS